MFCKWQFDFMFARVLVACAIMGRCAWQRSMDSAAMYLRSMLLQHVFLSVFSRRLHLDGVMPRIEGANGGCAVCMEATVREPLRCFAVFELKPPWGDTTNHGGGWVVGETHREGFVLTVCRKWHATCGTESDELSSCELGINSRSDERS